jgi:hydroxymethylbilane synthase
MEQTTAENTIRIGTRDSALAMWQAEWVRSHLLRHHPGLQVDLVPIKTQGDIILDVPLAQVGGKGLFVKELEEALLDGRVDLAVHSMKDVPALFPDGLGLAAILERADHRDAFLSLRYTCVRDLPPKARIGSSSLRRRSHLLSLRPDLNVIPLRGNVNTRITKLEQGMFDAIILAAAGVRRLGMTRHVAQYLETGHWIPAVGQGAVGVEIATGNIKAAQRVAPLNHGPTQMCLTAERAFQATLEGGCQVPMGGYAYLKGQRMVMRGVVSDLDGRERLVEEREGEAAYPQSLGISVAQALLERGADRILRAIYAGDEQR